MILNIMKSAILLLTVFLISCQSPQAPTRMKTEQTFSFEFHSSLWVNLHHFLYNEAFRSEKVHQQIDGLSDKEKKKLKSGVHFYQKRFQNLDLLFSAEMTDLNTRLSQVENRELTDSDQIPKDIRLILEDLAPIYKKSHWAKQNQENVEWIEKLKLLLSTHGAIIQTNLETILNEKFPNKLHRVDVVFESNWSGAYTYSPGQTVISSGRKSYSDLAALEMVFHEALHGGLFDPVQSEINQELARKNKKDELQLWHAVLFFTVGEVVRDVLEKQGLEYTPYAVKNGLFSKPRNWANLEIPLRKNWSPYLKNPKEGERKKALSQLIEELSKSL